MPELHFTIPITPKGQKRDRIGSFGGHAHSYKDKGQSQYEDQVRVLISQHKPEFPVDNCPVELTVVVYLPIPKSKPKCWKQCALEGKIRPLTKPDCSNALKNIEDVMNKIFYRDDCLITDEHVCKRYSDNPRWEITLSW